MKRMWLVLTRECPPKVFQDIPPPQVWLTSQPPLVTRYQYPHSCIWTSPWPSQPRNWRSPGPVWSLLCPPPPPSLSLVRLAQDCQDRTPSGGQERAPRAALLAARGRALLAVQAHQPRATHHRPGSNWVTPEPEVENTCRHVPVLSWPPPLFQFSTRFMRRVRRGEPVHVRTRSADNRVILVRLVVLQSSGDWNREGDFTRLVPHQNMYFPS